MTSWPKMKSTKFGMFHCSMTNDTVETWNCAHWFYTTGTTCNN